MRIAKKNFVYGLRWGNCSIGFEVHDSDLLGMVIEFKLFPLIAYWRIKKPIS
ncbi:hypothetical protein [Sutcliffiella halmapala]|uniref:hypothetical protein n=1 Tax=Sutcliffiella halmapala TaxID=79882 RepID=UPI0014749078|nr:hypothetical protein [Sutcliffiella halmapala]